MTQGGSNWISLFLCGAIAIVLSWATSGCFIGNYVQSQPNPDQYTGYYVTQPQSVTFFATTQSGTQEKSASVSLIPHEISQYMTNPVMLIMRNLSTGAAGLTAPSLVSPNDTPYLPIYVRSDSTLSYSGATSFSTYWQDPNCLSKIELFASGAVIRTAVANPSGNTHPLSGKIQLTLRLLTELSGNCGPTLQTIADCYEDSTKCGGSTPDENQNIQDHIHSFFGPYVQSQALSVADLPTLSEYAYEVSYQ